MLKAVALLVKVIKMKKKHLVITTDCFMPRWDGVTRFLSEIIPKLKDEYKITVLAPKFPGKFKGITGAVVIRLPLYNMEVADIYFSKFEYSKIKKIIEKADVVFNQCIGPIGMCGILAAKKYNKPVISYIHSIDWELTTKSIDRFKHAINIGTKTLAKYFYSKCDLLICPSLETLEKLTKVGIKASKEVVALGTDTEIFVPTKNKEKAKDLLAVEKGTFVIGFCGRIGREKNLITLYRAFRRLERKYDNVKLLIVGKGIKDLEEEFSSSRNIIMVGSQDNVVPYLQTMDVFVLSSLTETTSLATMEAMACGIPPVVTPVGYVKEYIKERENGMLFPFKNPTVLAMKIEILYKDKELREYLGRKARETIVKNYNWKKTAKEIIKIVEKYTPKED